MHYTIELLHTPTARFKFETESFIIRTLRWIINLRSSHVSKGKPCLSTNDIPVVQNLLFYEHDYLMVTHDEISSIQLFYSIKSRDAILRTDMWKKSLSPWCLMSDVFEKNWGRWGSHFSIDRYEFQLPDFLWRWRWRWRWLLSLPVSYVQNSGKNENPHVGYVSEIA